MRAGRRGGFPIGAHQVGRVMFGDEAHLARGLPRLVDHQIGHDQTGELAERVGQRQTRLIVADQADQNAFRAERRDIARHIAGTADLDRAVPDREHRRRRLGRNARDFAIDEIVEHEIADAEHGLLRNEPEGVFEIKHALPAKAFCASSTVAIGAIEISRHVALHRLFERRERGIIAGPPQITGLGLGEILVSCRGSRPACRYIRWPARDRAPRTWRRSGRESCAPRRCRR